MLHRLALMAVCAALLLGSGAPRSGNAPSPADDVNRPAPNAPAPADGFGFAPNAQEQRQSLPQINRRIALDAQALIKAQKFTEASDLLDSSEKDLLAFARRSRLELWDGTIAPIMRVLEMRRSALERAQSAATQPAGPAKLIPPHSTARLTPDGNRALAAIRADLNTAGTLIRQNKVTDAQRLLRSVDSRLRSLAENSRVPVWNVPIASAFQLADIRHGELKAKNQELEEAGEKARAAQKPSPASRPASQPVDEQHPRSGLPVGAPAPAFAALTLDGTPFTTQQLKGKWVLLDFWATWCGYCVKEMPHIREAYDAFGKDKRLVILSLSEDTQIGTPASFVAQNQIPWAQGFIGEDSPIRQMYHVTGIPTILLIDPQGNVAANNLRGNAIKEKLAQVLGAPAAQKPAK